MGYRGKVEQRAAAREMRANSMTLDAIATELGVSKSSVSVWVRDVPFTPSKRRYGPRVRPNALMVRKQEEIDRGLALGSERVGLLSDRDLLIAGAALYAGEGAKRDGRVVFTNSDPRMIELFLRWFRQFFEPDPARLRLRIYLHEGLDLEAAASFWSATTGIPRAQHHTPYRAVPDATIRHNKHEMGCAAVIYADSRVHREVVGMVHALLNC